MEPISVVTPIIAAVQIWQNAVRSITPDTQEHRQLLHEYTLYMTILEECTGTIQAAKEENLSKGVVLAVQQCGQIGQELAYRQAKIPATSIGRRAAFALVSWDKLKAKYKQFRDSVILVHDLVQEYCPVQLRGLALYADFYCSLV